MDDELQEQTSQDVDAQVELFMTSIGQMRQVMAGDFKHAHQHGMSSTQFAILGLVMHATEHDVCTISWLAQRLHLDPATVVRTVDSLEKRGLVKRHRGCHDRRQVLVEFTEEGRAAREEQYQRFRARVLAIFRSMSDEAREALLLGFQEFVLVGQTQMEQQQNGR